MPELRRLRSCVAVSLEASLSVEFAEGAFTPPLSVGPLARAYFDGTTLFLCSASTNAVVSVNGAALGTAWVPMSCPAVIWLGDERFEYTVVSDEPARVAPARTADPWGTHTVVMNAPQTLSNRMRAARTEPLVEPVAPTAPAPVARNQSFDTVTVIGPPPSLEAVAALVQSSALPAPSPNPASAEDAPEPAPSPPRSALSKLGARVRDDFQRTPRNIRVTLFALPLVAWAALGFGSSAESAPLNQSRTAASSAAPQKAATSATAPASASPDPVSNETRIEPAKPAIGNVMRGKRTLEASAADAAAHGAYAEAAQLYQELAAANPERPEFARAARILQGKATAAH